MNNDEQDAGSTVAMKELDGRMNTMRQDIVALMFRVGLHSGLIESLLDKVIINRDALLGIGERLSAIESVSAARNIPAALPPEEKAPASEFPVTREQGRLILRAWVDTTSIDNADAKALWATIQKFAPSWGLIPASDAKPRVTHGMMRAAVKVFLDLWHESDKPVYDDMIAAMGLVAAEERKPILLEEFEKKYEIVGFGVPDRSDVSSRHWDQLHGVCGARMAQPGKHYPILREIMGGE